MSVGEAAQPSEQPDARSESASSLWPITGYFLKLGTIGFGGPAALVGYMHRDLVERRRWLDEETYQLALALAQIMPGAAGRPDRDRHRLLPGRHARRHAGRARLRPAVVPDGPRAVGGVRGLRRALVDAGAVLRHRRRGHRDHRHRRVQAGSLDEQARSCCSGRSSPCHGGRDGLASKPSLPSCFSAPDCWCWSCGLAGLDARRWPSCSAARVLGGAAAALDAWSRRASPTTGGVLVQILLFFTKAGAFVFGSGLAIVPFLHRAWCRSTAGSPSTSSSTPSRSR